jgi:hypothetical protein
MTRQRDHWVIAIGIALARGTAVNVHIRNYC